MVHIRLLNKINEGFLSLVKVKRVVTDAVFLFTINEAISVKSDRYASVSSEKLVSSSHQIMSRLLDGRLASK